MRNMRVNALIAVVTVLLTLILLEAVVRVGGETDADGQFTFMGYALEPYALPVTQLRRALEAYLEREEAAHVSYDERLGWTHRPNVTGSGGNFTVNGAGLRSKREYSQTPLPDTLRIAIFGDSFALGAEVSDDETWGYQLEMKLNQAGIRTEVLNFGVGGYGMDQAFLRWQEAGRDYAPDMVIFGFQPENLNRNVNVFRQLYFLETGIPFSKPRFILNNAEGLELINAPTIPLEQIVAVFESFGSHPFASYEYYYDSRYAAAQWWSSSRLAAFLYAVLKRDEDQQNIQDNADDYGADSERGRLGKAIVDAFAADVMKHETDFFVMNTITRWSYHQGGRRHPYQFLLDHFDDAYHYISFQEQLDNSLDEAWWAAGGHYGPVLNRIAARAAADKIQSCIESGACALPRFEDKSVLFTAAP